MKGTNKYVEHWDKDKRDSGNCFRNYNGTIRKEKRIWRTSILMHG